jgi:Spy/CpxP family protein refolding chaperone
VKIHSQFKNKIMKNTSKSLMIVVLAFFFISSGSLVYAQSKNEKNDEGRGLKTEKNDMHGKMCGKGCVCGIKGLSDEQKHKIEKIEASNKKEMLQYRNLLDEKKSHLKTLETSDNADLSAINKTIDEISSIEGEIMKKHAATKQEIRKVLNDEQRIQFDLKKGKMKMDGKKDKNSCKHMNSENEGDK